MTKKKVKLRLTLDVTYIPNGVAEPELRGYMRDIADHAAGRGLMTGESPAEVDEWSATVTEDGTSGAGTYTFGNNDGTESFEIEADGPGDAALEVLRRLGWCMEDGSEDAGVEESVNEEPPTPVSDFDLTADQLDAKYNPEGGGEHPRWTREDWRLEVSEDNTLRGYWDWVVSMLEQDRDDLEQEVAS